MKSRDDAAYRLELAKGYLARAESDAVDGQWDSCLANAQEAVENAGKSILAHFRPVPHTHDLIEPLEQLLKPDAVPAAIRQRIEGALDAFRGMGFDTHVRAAYGDEETRTPPWELIEEAEARTGLEKARRAVALAETVYAEMTAPPRKPDTPAATEDM